MNTESNASQDRSQNLADDANSLVSATADAAENGIDHARNRISSALDNARDVAARVQKQAIQGAKAADQAVRANPYPAIGVAFAVGAIIGFLFRRRND